MTEKELLYVQDVLGHEKHFQTASSRASRESWNRSTARCSKAFTAYCKEDLP